MKHLCVFLLACVATLICVSQAYAQQNKIIYFGFYTPKEDLHIAQFTITSVDLWAGGDATCNSKNISSDNPPVMIEYSTKDSNNGSIVNPTTSQIKGNKVSFSGTDPDLGNVSFEGTINLPILKHIEDKYAQDEYYVPAGNPIVLKGNFVIAGKNYKNIELLWTDGGGLHGMYL